MEQYWSHIVYFKDYQPELTCQDLYLSKVLILADGLVHGMDDVNIEEENEENMENGNEDEEIEVRDDAQVTFSKHTGKNKKWLVQGFSTSNCLTYVLLLLNKKKCKILLKTVHLLLINNFQVLELLI